MPETATLDLTPSDYPGGVALWGSVPAVYDTTSRPVDRGIHVHARRTVGGDKEIDRTYRRLRVPYPKDLLSGQWLEVDEVDAINFMVTTVFEFQTIAVACGHCGFPHLDRDWFAVHPHRRHQCHGCGRLFSDTGPGIGNPVSTLRNIIHPTEHRLANALRTIEVSQTKFPGGIQIWGSNPAIVWTSSFPEEVGIHLHCFDNPEDEYPSVDNTFSRVLIDDVELNAVQIRYYMAQSAMPHLEDRIISINCPSCGMAHFDTGELAYTPHIDHDCQACGASFRATSSIKKSIGNPFVSARLRLSATALNPLRNDRLGLRPETI